MLTHVSKLGYFSCSHLHCERLKDLVADHLDHIHYINDILCLNIVELNEILTEYLLDRLIIPLYLYSLVTDHNAQVCSKLSFFSSWKNNSTGLSFCMVMTDVHECLF